MKITLLFSYLKPYAGRSVVGALFKLFEAILELYMPMLMVKVIDVGIANGDKDYVIKMCFVLVGIVFLGLCCAMVCQYLASKVSQGYGTNLRNALFDKIMSLSRSQTDEYTAASLINRTTVDVNNLQYFIAMLIRLVIRAPFLCIGGIVMAFIIDPGLAIIVVAVLPVFIFFLAYIMKKTLPLHSNVQKKLDSMTLVLRECISGVRVIRAFARSDEEKVRFEAASAENAAANMDVAKVAIRLNPITTLIMNLAIIAVLWMSGAKANYGSITNGEIVAFINYINQILAALVVVANLVVTFSKAYSSALRVTAVMSAECDMPNGNVVPDFSSTDDIIKIENVSFSYNGGADDLSGISFTVKKGMSVGIIGGTGSGKTTLVNLIPRFYDARAGAVYVAGTDVKNAKIKSLRNNISVVSQKTELISGTIKENIAFGRDISDEDAIKALKAACGYDFVEAKPGKLESEVEQNGANFSGGQKQRLSIARALAHPCRILILDDSSSALDYATDAQVRKNIREQYSDVTVIAVSQRVGSIKHCDMLLVMDDGRLAGCGTHDELIKNCRTYREICASQGVTE